MTKEIKMHGGYVILVDDDMFDFLNQWTWSAHHTRPVTKIYARRKEERTFSVYMHRVIMNPPEGFFVDHIDANGLNNQKCNLRLVTPRQNNQNRVTRNITGYKGVTKHFNKFISRFGINYLGLFETPEEAARAYDEQAKKEYGEFSRLNFPNE